MKAATTTSENSRAFKCWRYLVFFCLFLFCLSGITIGLFASFLLVFRQESLGLAPKVLLYFIIVPTLCVIGSTVVGWTSIRRKKVVFVKFFAILFGLSALLEFAGSLWCFGSIQRIQNEVLVQVSEKFSKISSNPDNENYWNNIQTKFKCCGFYGPADYKSRQAIPFSCCGSDAENITQGSCSLVWQKGCSDVIVNRIAQDSIMMGLVALIVACLQVPGIFFSWCFANRISRENI